MQHLANMSILASSSGWTEPFASSLLSCIHLVCLGPPSSLLFVPKFHIAHVHPPLTTRWLNTIMQVTTWVHDILCTINIYAPHNISSYISSKLLGRPAGPELSCWEQVFTSDEFHRLSRNRVCKTPRDSGKNTAWNS